MNSGGRPHGRVGGGHTQWTASARLLRNRLLGVTIPVLLVLVVVLVCMLQPRQAAAHAAYASSQPTASEVLSSTPGEIIVRFTERLDRSYSRLELYDQTGNMIEGTDLVAGADEYSMILRSPDLPNGTYSVLWRTLSEDDGHSAQNYFAFTIGTEADIATVVIPTSSLDAGDAPQWAKTMSRWLALIGLAVLMAVWPIWNIVIRPALRPIWRDAPNALRRVHRFAMYAVIAAIGGTLIALMVQALTLTDGNPLDRLLNTLGQTRYGRLTLFRLGLFLALGLILSACAWWFRNRRKVESGLAWIVTLLLPLPFSLIAHASAQPSGRNVAITADYLHLLGFSVWFGGLAMIFAVLLPVLKGLGTTDRRTVLKTALPRFSAIALTGWVVLGLTGFYAGWLHVGNLTALRTTDYGQALIVKLSFVILVLILAAINLVVISKKISREDGPIWHKRLSWTIGGEIALMLIALLAVGQLTSLQPARNQVVEEAQQVTVPFDLQGRNARLLLAPGTTGVNHFRLEVGGPNLATNTEMILRMTMPSRDDLGIKELTLSRVAGNAFEHHGNELSISGDWQLTLIERTSGTAPINADTTFTIANQRTGIDIPGNPWRFEPLGGTTGLLLCVFGIAGLVLAWYVGRTPMRKESAGLATAALALGVILLLQARIDPILANSRGEAIDPNDLAAIQRGEEIYTQQCLSCHGAELRGDGPAAGGMQPPAADFSAEHTMVHSESDLVYWVQSGKQGTAMPGFGGTLSDPEILDVLSFIKNRQESQLET